MIDDTPRVLFITDNGHGVGHLTRLLAVAQRANGRFKPFFATLSEAYPALIEAGLPVEYMPSYVKLQVGKPEWQRLFATRILDLIRHTRARAVIIDHISPPPVIGEMRAKSSGIEWIWSRRGMWRKGYNTQSIQTSRSFDTIVEPGDIARAIDVGITTRGRVNVTVVSPVVLVRPEDQLDRGRARAGLGIPEDGKAILIQLSDSSPDKLAALVGRARDVVRDTIANEQIHVFAPIHLLHGDHLPEVAGVLMKSVYPMARYLKAFDGVISTAGYNSYHEVVASGLPSVFVARDTGSLDDQRRRAEFSELSGRAHFAEDVYSPKFRRAVKRMLATGEGRVARSVTEEMGSFDGATEFADVVAARIETRRFDPFACPDASELETIAASPPMDFSSGVIRAGSSPGVERRGYIGLDITEDRLRAEVERIGEEQRITRAFKPVFLIEDVDPQPFDTWQIQFETVMTASEWDGVGSDYQTYRDSRLGDFAKSYGLDRVVDLRMGRPSPFRVPPRSTG